MGNHLRCYKCNMVLRPCNDFSDLKQDYIYGRNVHVFNGGEYFRLVGYNELYECRDCFYKPIREEERLKQEQKKKEKKKQEEEEEQKRRDQQRAREAEERKRREELNQRLEESCKQAQEQLEEQVSRIVSEKHQFQASAYLSEFQSNYKSDEESELLKTLSSKGTVATLNLTQLNKNQLGNTLLALEKLLFAPCSTLKCSSPSFTSSPTRNLNVFHWKALQIMCSLWLSPSANQHVMFRRIFC